jgi:predicted Fe-Mo cluster-binding NifX family protein
MLHAEVQKGGDTMKTTVIVPVSDNNGLNSKIAEHFGRAPFYAIVALDKDGKVEDVETLENKGEHFAGEGHMHDHILERKPNAIITYGMGPRGLTGFQEAGVAVLKANADTVKDVIAAYNDDKLQELTEGCHHAHHHQN